jgi:hypothetical protein
MKRLGMVLCALLTAGACSEEHQPNESRATGGSSGASGTTTGGTGGSAQSTLPTCVTDLYAECLPDEPCIDDAEQRVTCFASGVRIERQSTPIQCDGRWVERTLRADGTRCMSYSSQVIGCEIYTATYITGEGEVVATRSNSTPSIVLGDPRCSSGPTVPCDPKSARCDFARTCTPGVCPPGGEAGAAGGPG